MKYFRYRKHTGESQVAQLFAKIPRERIGVLIGPNGKVKDYIEKKVSVNLEIDSETGDITITLNKDASDPSLLFKAKEIVQAIGRGFSPRRAYKLMEDDYCCLTIIDLREIFGRNPSNIKRIKGRVIGKDGRTRRVIEELTEAHISIYGFTIAIIGGICRRWRVGCL